MSYIPDADGRHGMTSPRACPMPLPAATWKRPLAGVITALLLLFQEVHAVGWSAAPPLLEPRQEVAVAALDGRVYVVGGYRADASIADTVEVYDPATASWSFASPAPTPIHHASAAAVGGKLYLIGGFIPPFTPINALFEYDPASARWTQKAPMPTARGSMGGAVIDGKIYLAGGSPPARERDFAVYDPMLDQWTTLPLMPTARNHLAAAAVAGKFYAVGGRSGGINGVLSTVEAFDPMTSLWSSGSPMPTARGGVAGATSGPYVVVFGGEGNLADPAGIFEQVEAYDTNADRWIKLPPMPTPRHGIAAGVIEDRVYIPGGGDNQGLGVSAVLEVFDATGIAAFSGVFCDVAMSQPGYTLGEQVTLTKLRIMNLADAPSAVELKAWAEDPQGPTLSILNLGGNGTLQLPAGLDAELGPMDLFSVTADTPLGDHGVGCRTLNPITGAQQVLDQAPFKIE